MQSSNLEKLLIICGPTATGKTSLALKLADKFNGVLISCDSRQVYRHMDEITGKDLAFNFKYQISNIKYKELRVGFYSDGKRKIFGYDLVRPDQPFDVKMYMEFFCRVVAQAWESGCLPIVVGGTGMYLKTLLNPPKTLGIPVNEPLRRGLADKNVGELLEILNKEDPVKFKSMNESEKMNPTRLIRAIEVCLAGDDLTLSNVLVDYIGQIKMIDSLWLGLNFVERKKLYERIDERVDVRINDKMVEELGYLMEKDYLRYVPAVTIGYQQLIRAMGDGISIEQAIREWKFAEHSYARRQLTWFNKMNEVNWFDSSEYKFDEKVVKLVDEWYDKNIKKKVFDDVGF